MSSVFIYNKISSSLFYFVFGGFVDALPPPVEDVVLGARVDGNPLV